MNYLFLERTDSTNTYAAEHEEELESPVMIVGREQTAGRGQRGNSWESEPGKNLTFSVLYRPTSFPAREQFAISEAAALSVVDALKQYGVDAKVKWPNDIYVGDSKICGILIENSLLGTCLQRSVIGAGVNVNQREFLSDAPNPISMYNILGSETDLDEFRETLGSMLETRLSLSAAPEGRKALHEEFRRSLWRGDGKPHPFFDVAAQERYEGTVEDVDCSGFLTVRDAAGGKRRYAFKEVEWLLPQHRRHGIETDCAQLRKNL